MKLEHVMARSIAELRHEKLITQCELAHRMRVVGLNWTPNRVTQIETLRRKVSLSETIALAWVFGVPVTRLLAGPDDEQVETPDGGSLPLAAFRSAFQGEQAPPVPRSLPSPEDDRRRALLADSNDALRRPAKKLGVTPAGLNEMAQAKYGRAFLAERDARLGDGDRSDASVRTRLGHVTRGMLAELADRSRP